MSSECKIWDYALAKKRSLGQDQILAEVMRSFLSDSTKLINSLQQGVENRDFETIRFHAHALKGSSANVAAHELSEAAKAIEYAAKDNDLNRISDLMIALENARTLLFTMVQEFLDYLK